MGFLPFFHGNVSASPFFQCLSEAQDHFFRFFSYKEIWASLAIIVFSWNLDLRVGFFFSIPRFLAGSMFFVLAMSD